MPYPEMQERDPYPSPRVRFEPAYLDFGQVHIGEESVKKVTIFNLNHDESILINVSTIEYEVFKDLSRALLDHDIKI